MFERGRLPICVALLLAAALTGCNGKPEDLGQGSSADSADVKTPAPPYPAWAGPMIGKGLGQVSQGAATCKGQVDLVSAKHTGRRPGTEIEGWGWDAQGAKPLAKVLFTDQNDRVVGAATVGNPRSDVVTNLPEVKTPKVGWKGVAGVTSGPVTAIGLTDTGASCVLSSVAL